MSKLRLLAVSVAMAGLAGLAMQASAQARPVGGGMRLPPPSPQAIGGFNGGFPVFVVQREVPVIIEKEVVRDVAVPTPSPSPEGEGKRKPYVVGSTYASLPGGCMKLIELAASYYFCGGGEWYRQEGKLYRAVKRQL